MGGSRTVVNVVGALVLLIGGGVVLSIAVSNFVTFGVRAKQSEVRVGLKKMFAAQASHFAAHGTYAQDVLAFGALSDWDRYACFLGTGPTFLRADRPAEDRWDAGFAGFSQRPRMTTPNLKRPLTADDLPPTFSGERLGLRDCPGEKCAATMACIGDIDADRAFDVWSVSTVDRKNLDGDRIPAGEPHNDFDDVKDRPR